MRGSEGPKSCTPHRDLLRKGSEGGSEGSEGLRKSWAGVKKLAPIIGGPFIEGWKVGPKGSEKGPKAFGRRQKACTPHRDLLLRGSEGGSEGV